MPYYDYDAAAAPAEVRPRWLWHLLIRLIPPPPSHFPSPRRFSITDIATSSGIGESFVDFGGIKSSSVVVGVVSATTAPFDSSTESGALAIDDPPIIVIINSASCILYSLFFVVKAEHASPASPEKEHPTR